MEPRSPLWSLVPSSKACGLVSEVWSGLPCCLPAKFWASPPCASRPAGGAAEPVPLRWLRQVYPPALPHQVDQRAGLLELRAVLLQVPRHCHKHKESSAGNAGLPAGRGHCGAGTRASHTPCLHLRVRAVWRKEMRWARWARSQMAFGQEEMKNCCIFF